MKQSKRLSFAEEIRDILLKEKLTLAVAESVTCGWFQASFAAIECTSKFFQGGITVYNLGQKVRHLNIEPIEAENNNCVSTQVSEQMALQVAQFFLADVSISITGYASPLPEKDVHELYAFFSVSKNGKILATKKIHSQKTTPQDVQRDYCEQVLEHAAQLLRKK